MKIAADAKAKGKNQNNKPNQTDKMRFTKSQVATEYSKRIPTTQTKTVARAMFGMVAFEEDGMPWTAVRGKYRLLKKEVLECFGDEPHFLLDLGNGKTCYVPESSVVLLPNK